MTNVHCSDSAIKVFELNFIHVQQLIYAKLIYIILYIVTQENEKWIENGFWKIIFEGINLQFRTQFGHLVTKLKVKVLLFFLHEIISYNILWLWTDLLFVRSASQIWCWIGLGNVPYAKHVQCHFHEGISFLQDRKENWVVSQENCVRLFILWIF